MISIFIQGNIDIHYLYLYLLEEANLSDHLLKLNKSLYRLKQSAKIQYFILYNTLVELDFSSLKTENCIVINKDKNIIICVYIDDLVIISLSIDTIDSTMKSLEKYFKLKNLGLVKNYLGIDIDLNISKAYIKLNQSKYIKKILDKYKILDCKDIYTPIDSDVGYKLVYNKGLATKDTIKQFQGVIGLLLYLTLGIKLDIAYSIIKLSRSNANPSKEHIVAVRRILRYIRATINYSVTYYKSKNSHYI